MLFRIVQAMILLTVICNTGYAAADKPIAPKEYQQMLDTGIDVNWALFKSEIRAYSTKEPKDFKEMGFDHIRIRFKDTYENLGMTKETYFKHIDKVITDVLDARMIPILAFVAEKFKLDPSQSNFDHAVQLWRYVAERYKDYTHKLSFDLIIEPAKAIKKQPKRLNDFYEVTVNLIRKNNPTRIIMIAPSKLAQPRSLAQLKIPSKANNYLMVETHFYAAGPQTDNPRKKWTTGTPKEKKRVKNILQTALKWQAAHDIPIWIGAIMPGNYNKGDNYSISEQMNFATFFSSLFHQHNVPFAINADHKFYDYEKKVWRKDRLPVIKAIFKVKRKRKE